MTSLRGLPVLVVDDNATNRRILEETTAPLGHGATSRRADGGAVRDAEAHEAGTPYPLVLLDAMMPGMDGFSLASEIKNQPALAGRR